MPRGFRYDVLHGGCAIRIALDDPHLVRMVRVYKQIPNLITVARLGLTVAFFALLHVNDQENFPRAMWIAFVVFVIAALTDILDGYLARRWKAESAFGRVVDPFVDKIMICGAFIFFASDDFINVVTQREFRDVAVQNGQALPGLAHSIHVTGVMPWMAVVLIGREFLITGIRGLFEARGINFRADWAGKIKMFAQSFAVGAILVDLACVGHVPWVRMVRDISVWITVTVTVLSSLTYIFRAKRILSE